LFLGAAAVLLPHGATVQASNAVDLQLVLAVDTSGSVNAQRFELQRRGYADAFRSPQVANAIRNGRSGAIAVCMTYWTGYTLQAVAIPWMRVTGDPNSMLAFAGRIDDSIRVLFGGGTSISGAIDHAVRQFPLCPFPGAGRGEVKRVIDVSGDGRNNRGRPPDQARDEAVALDITINGLPILSLEPDLDRYYQEHVIGGTGAFLIAAETFEQFGDAVRRKLVQEIS
jgi:hypothetical protein